ncbi:MAG: hypothetical protein KatS3mg052_0423 [Candidatus Roseilinea sp.]|nr:MAG: hypothetical protein KatS3mg052_0423 [Candidatus Roseilinea sp.]
MKVVVDEAKYRRLARVGRIALFGSLGVLLGGLLLTLFGPQLGLLAPENSSLFFILYLIILLVGFTASRVGFHYGNRYLAPTRPDMVLRESLKGLDRKYALMLFARPTNYMLIEPGGVTVFVVRNQEGKVTYKEGKWKRKESLLRFWFGRDEPLGDPTADITEELRKVNQVLTEKLPTLKIPLRGIIVFSNPKVVLDVEPSPIAVLRAADLKDYIRGAGKLKELPNSLQRKVREALGAPELPRPEA